MKTVRQTRLALETGSRIKKYECKMNGKVNIPNVERNMKNQQRICREIPPTDVHLNRYRGERLKLLKTFRIFDERSFGNKWRIRTNLYWPKNGF